MLLMQFYTAVMNTCLDSGPFGRHVLCDTFVGIAVHNTLAKKVSTLRTQKADLGLPKSWKLAQDFFFHTCFAMKVHMQRASFCSFQRGLWKRFCVRGAVQIPIQRRKLKKEHVFFVFCVGWEFVLHRGRKVRFGARLGGAFLHRNICKFICKNLRYLPH